MSHFKWGEISQKLIYGEKERDRHRDSETGKQTRAQEPRLTAGEKVGTENHTVGGGSWMNPRIPEHLSLVSPT